MINRETGLASDPLVETALKAMADWVRNYRNAIGFNSEFGTCGPDEVMRMAKEIGVSPSQFHELVSKGPGNANLLKTMLVALHVDPKLLADMDPLIMRELKWLCITCSNKKRCEHELAKGTTAEHFGEFCPNAVSLDELLRQSTITVSVSLAGSCFSSESAPGPFQDGIRERGGSLGRPCRRLAAGPSGHAI